MNRVGQRLIVLVADLCCLTLALGFFAFGEAQGQDVPLWERFSRQVSNTEPYQNPFQDVSLTATFTAPSGKTYEQWGFYRGEQLWEIRFMPNELGSWSYEGGFSDGSDSVSGSFTCVPSDIPGPLKPYSQNQRWFASADDTPVLLVGYYTDGLFRTNQSFWQPWIDDKVAFGFTLLSSGPFDLNWCQVQGCTDRAPWPESGADFDYTRFDLAAWDAYEEIVTYIQSKGVYYHTWGGFLGGTNNYPAPPTDELKRLHLRYGAARFNSYWHLINNNVTSEWQEGYDENTMNYWGEFVGNLYPFHMGSVHPLDVGLHTTGDLAYDWITYDSSQKATYSQFIESFNLSGRPQLSTEEVWWPIPQSSATERRRAAWSFTMGGVSGFLGGKNSDGSLEPPEGNSLNKGDHKILSEFMHSIAFGQMSPRDDLLVSRSNSDIHLLAHHGSEYVIYFPAGGDITIDLFGAGGGLEVEWLNPQTGDITFLDPVPGGGEQSFAAPDTDDWVLHLGGLPPDETPPTVPQNLDATAQSEDQIDLTWQASSDPESGVSYYKIYRDGMSVGQPSSTSFSDTNLDENTTYTYEIAAVNGVGLESQKSAPALATTFADTTPPTIASVSVISTTQLDVQFSEPVEEISAENEVNYGIDHGIVVFNANLDLDLSTVHLTTSEHVEEIIYTITVNNIQDRASIPNTIEPNSSANYQIVLELEVSNLSKEDYRTAELGVGDQYYVDRAYTIINVPPEYEGLLWIKTANDDKLGTLEQFLTFTVNQNVTVYVAYDNRASSLPFWVTDHYTPTGAGIGVSDVDASPLQLWARDFPAGDVVMGGNRAEGASGAASMYVILLRGYGPAADTTAPLISQVAATDITDSTATIQWSTDELSDSRVEYGLTIAYGSMTPLDTAMVSQHSLGLSGLMPGSLYHYRVQSTDGTSNTARSEDHTFEANDETPPQIFSIEVSALSDSAATVGWSTDEPADSRVEYGLTPGIYDWCVEDTFLVVSHSLELVGLTPATTYFFCVRSQDAADNVATSAESTFVTLETGDETPPQIFSIEVSALSDTGAIIGWSTDELADSRVEYGLAPGFYDWSVEDTLLTLSHSLGIISLTSATQYHFRVLSQDTWGNASTSPDCTFVTKHELPGPPGKPEHYDD